MNRIILILIIFVFGSCRMSYLLSGEVLVFRRELLPVLSDCYLFLKPQGNFEIYYKVKEGVSEIGKWERRKDTLTLTLEVTYDFASDTLYFASGRKQIYVIERDYLKDITNYTPLGEINGIKLHDEIKLNYKLIHCNTKRNLSKLIPISE